MTEKRPLTPKQRAFVAEYLVDMSAAEAARRAGYSSKTARSIAHELLGKPHIQDAVREAMEQRAERMGVTQDDVVMGLLAETKGDTHAGRIAAWAHLGKHLGMFKEQVEHSGNLVVEGFNVTFSRPDDKRSSG
jgi:phage terminase small subunit